MNNTKFFFIKTNIQHVILLVVSLFSAFGNAHEPSSIHQSNFISIKSAINFQSGAYTETDEAWLIPGVLLGGEALPRQAGAAIDDIQLTGRINLDGQLYASGKLGYHQHNGSGEIKLENFWLGKYFQLSDQNIIKVDFGSMATDVTPTANHHASADKLNTTPLLAETFFAGHHQDTGAKVNWYWQDYQIGIELWNGSQWPASSNEGNFSVFGKYHGTVMSTKMDLGFWLMSGTATERSDSRYNAEHSHSNSLILAPDAAFTGDIKTYGSYLKLTKELDGTMSIVGEFEWIANEQSGALANSTQSATVNLKNSGFRAMFGGHWQAHSLSVQYEMLAVNNLFTQTTALFIEQQGLNNDNFEPNRTMVSYSWQWQPGLGLRAETILDDTRALQKQQVWTLGFTWAHNLL